MDPITGHLLLFSCYWQTSCRVERSTPDVSEDPVLGKKAREDEQRGQRCPLSSDGSVCHEVFSSPSAKGHHLSVYPSLNVTNTSAKPSHGLDGILPP